MYYGCSIKLVFGRSQGDDLPLPRSYFQGLRGPQMICYPGGPGFRPKMIASPPHVKDFEIVIMSLGGGGTAFEGWDQRMYRERCDYDVKRHLDWSMKGKGRRMGIILSSLHHPYCPFENSIYMQVLSLCPTLVFDHVSSHQHDNVNRTMASRYPNNLQMTNVPW